MPAKLNKFEMPRTDIEAAMRICAMVLAARRNEAVRGAVIRLHVLGPIRAAKAWLSHEAALAA